MKTVSLVSQKGGSGKTTLATSLATQGCIEGLKTLLVDLDPQGSSYKWGNRRNNSIPTVITAQAVALDQIVENAEKQRTDLLLIDTAPHSEKDARKACEVSDLVLIPCRPSIHDLDAIEDTLNITYLTQTLAFVVLNAVHPNSIKQYEDVKNALELAYDSIKILSGFYISNRSEFIHSASNGLTANETEPDGKASLEIKKLFDMLDSIIGLYPVPRTYN